MVGRLVLVQLIGVRIPIPEQSHKPGVYPPYPPAGGEGGEASI